MTVILKMKNTEIEFVIWDYWIRSWCDAEEALFNSYWTGIFTEWNTISYSTKNVIQKVCEVPV